MRAGAHDPIPLIRPPVRTGEAIRTWFADTIAFGTRIELVAPIRGSHADAAALMFHVTSGRPKMLIRSLDVCAFDAEGRTSPKAYWGPGVVEIIAD